MSQDEKKNSISNSILATQEIVAPLTYNPVMLGMLLWSLRHLEYQNQTINSDFVSQNIRCPILFMIFGKYIGRAQTFDKDSKSKSSLFVDDN